VIEASARLTVQARWLREHGAAGSTDELRAAAYVASLTGRSLDTLLPAANDQDGAGAAPDDGTVGEGLRRDGPAAAGGPASSESAPAAGSRLGGTITLTMPLSAWLGLGEGPGEVAGYGPADAGTCRELAARTGPAVRWCLTLTGTDGRAVGHACAPAGSPGPGSIRWAAGLRTRMQFLEAGTCSHARRTSRYRPPANLAHLVRFRQRTCSFPGCRRPARRCDLDLRCPMTRAEQRANATSRRCVAGITRPNRLPAGG
jgi:hypothetical protein